MASEISVGGAAEELLAQERGDAPAVLDVSRLHGVDMSPARPRSYARRPVRRKGGRTPPLVYACEILAQLRRWPAVKETFIGRKAYEGC